MVYEPIESEAARSNDVHVPALSQGTQMYTASSSSRSQQMVVQSGSGSMEDTCERGRQVNSSLDAAPYDDDEETSLF